MRQGQVPIDLLTESCREHSHWEDLVNQCHILTEPLGRIRIFGIFNILIHDSPVKYGAGVSCREEPQGCPDVSTSILATA